MRLLDTILNFLYEIVLGCRHEKVTRPFTLEHQTYKVCLDCGRQILYSAESMRPLSFGEVRRMKNALARQTNVVPLTARLQSETDAHSESSAAA